MPAKTDYSRKTKWKNEPYRGERSIGGNFVYSDENMLDKHLFVHRVAPGGFDWGPDASDEKASQLAIALLAPFKGVDLAVKEHHLFAENFVRRELTEDSWEINRSDFRNPEYRRAIDGRNYPENTAPGPEDVPDLEDVDLDGITYAEEIALAKKYEDVLRQSGNRRDNLRRLLAIWDGDEDPSSDRVSTGTIYRIKGLSIPSNANRRLAREFDTMGELASWVCFGSRHSRMDGISEATAEKLRDARSGFIQYFGGKEYIPELEDQEMSLPNTLGGKNGQQTLEKALGRDDD
jgi:hypothetical protein